MRPERRRPAAVSPWLKATFLAATFASCARTPHEEAPATWDDTAYTPRALCATRDVGATPVRRLTATELRRTLTELFGRKPPALEDLPVVIAVPAVSGSTGLARAGIKKRVEKALGSTIEG